MHEEPLHLIPQEHRVEVTAALNKDRGHDDPQVTIEGDLCPFCRQMFNERMDNTTATGAASSRTFACAG